MNLLEKKAYVDENLHYVPKEEIELYEQNFAWVYTRNSACIEGHEISLEEVVSITKSIGFSVKRDGTLVRSVYNHFLAFNMVKERAKETSELTEDFFKDVHEELMKGIINGGLYRNVNITIKGSNHTPCDYVKVYDRMNKFFYDINHYNGTALERAAYAHLQIAKVHPFLDGNGRMARLMMNFCLISAGFLPISISRKTKIKTEYFASLEAFKVDKTMEPFISLLNQLLNNEYDRLILLIDQYKDKVQK